MNADQMKEFVELCRKIADPDWEPQPGELIGTHFGGLLVTYKKRAERSVTGAVIGHIVTNEHGIDIRFDDDHFRETFVRIPPVYDYQHPERGLWGMVDWSDWYSNVLADGAFLLSWEGRGTKQISDILPIALAKAIIWQEERKER